MSDIDKEIAEFHRAARKRKAMIFAISGVLMLALGAVLLVVTFTVVGEGGDGRTRYPGKVIFAGFGLVIAGLISCYNAYRVGSGQVNDVE